MNPPEGAALVALALPFLISAGAASGTAGHQRVEPLLQSRVRTDLALHELEEVGESEATEPTSSDTLRRALPVQASPAVSRALGPSFPASTERR